MGKYIVWCFMMLSITVFSKEWKSLRAYKKITNNENLLPSDWLKSDRIHNTSIWQKANAYNLTHNLPQEYTTILERKFFYKWLFEDFRNKGHEVVWVMMAHFISNKVAKLDSAPFAFLCGNKILNYAHKGSEVVFNNAFFELNNLFTSVDVLKESDAKLWDENMLYCEQYIWVESVYKTMDTKSLKKLMRIARGHFLYGLLVSKYIRFQGDFLNAESRYKYAINVLKPYCEDRYKE